MPIDSIDSIKRRMIRNASRIWGYQDEQDINSFDPVLGLLIGAIAEELNNISRKIDVTDARVVEKMLELLFNKNIFSHAPAHAVAYSKPLQSRVHINKFYQFYFNKAIQNKKGKDGSVERKDIFFTPTANSTLFNGEVKFMVAGKYLYEIDRSYKEILSEIPHTKQFSRSRLLIGVKFDPLIDTLDGLSFFFSFKNIQDEDRLYQTLHTANWQINGKAVTFKKGFSEDNSQVNNSLEELIKKDISTSYKTCSFINEYYKRKFVTLQKGDNQLSKFTTDEGKAHILSDYITDKKSGVFEKDIIWFDINLPQTISEDEINDLTVSINCYPVMNRELHEQTYSIVKGVNIIPLLTDDLFFDIESLTNSNNEVYQPKNIVGYDGNNSKTFVLRQGGINRFDSRDAREMISHLVSLVRDEASAFAAQGADLITSELKQLDQILSRLKQRVYTSEVTNDLTSFVTIESKVNFDKIHVRFWSVAGDLANNIRPGTKLTLAKGVDIDPNSLSLITQTVGGRQKMNKEDKLNTLRRSLLSKGKIVTVEDIKALCFEQFGKTLKSVDVRKGVQIESSSGKGMSRTLDIHLTFINKNKMTNEDIKHIITEIKIRLLQGTINLLPYRIFVE